ncbi:serine/threonine/tyrosine-interacting-like protein 1 [Dendronephthya gigantea]|uniref:serine/threonine/tyrosine-interacting-like protein 1 n=1 Tax=Dendronephthya gigantea TaxID=151771 RepID=UPI001068D8D3|nr:serine/threonine/tyrosine-interacting-like protein 1 [Dendronephthya gigantea]
MVVFVIFLIIYLSGNAWCRAEAQYCNHSNSLKNNMADTEGICLWNSTDIFNILNQTDTKYPRISDPNYILLLDTRKRKDYNESHILTAKYAPRNESGSFAVPYEAELQTKRYCIVYDSRSDTLNDQGSPAVACARMLWDNGSKNPVVIIKGGYELFSALYPFLRTQKIIYTQKELDLCKTYPVEIIPGLLYSGTLEQGQNPAVNKALKCKAHVNVSCRQDVFCKDENSLFQNKVFEIPIEDSDDADIYSYFANAVEFIDGLCQPGNSVLVCSELNISRSITIVIAYLMWKKHWTLQKAFAHVKQCKQNMQPNRTFIEQLSKWEGHLYGQVVTDISEPDY